MSQQVKVSVLISACQVEAYIDQCLESVMAQTLEEIEILVTDDCSTDATLAHIEDAARRDERIRILRNPVNLGTFQSRKDAALASRGEYILYVDGDDYLEPNACELAYEKAQESGADILQFGCFVENCRSLPQRWIEGRQEILAPYLGAPLQEPLVTACFEKKEFGHSLLCKFWRGERTREIIAAIPDGCFVAAEDIYQAFFLLMECESYQGIEDRLYHYCYGRGVTGQNTVSLENFATRCHGARVYRTIERFLTEQEQAEPGRYKAEQLRAGWDALACLKQFFVKEELKLWLNRLEKKDRAEAYLLMESAWGMEGPAFVGMLAEHGWAMRKQVAEALAGAPFLPYGGRPVKTLAFYFSRARNGGAKRVVTMLSSLLAERKDETGAPRYKVLLITEEEPQEDDYPLSPLVIREQIPAYRESKGANYPPRAAAWARIISAYEVDAVFYSQWTILHLTWDLLCIKRTERQPAFVIHTHSWCGMMYREDSDALGERSQSYRLADGVVALSEMDRLFWSRINPRTRFIPNPCFARPNEARRARFGKHILWVGRLSAEKQPLEIPRIMRELTARDPQIICHVVGDDKPALRQRLEESITAEGLSDNVILEGFQRDVAPFYEACSVCLMTSVREGYPLTLYEAAAFGMPTVYYELPWLSYCSDTEGGIAVPQGDAAAAAEAILELVHDQALWQAHSDALFRSAQIHGERDVAEDWLALISDLETGRQPEYPEIDRTTRIFLDQLSFNHGAAVRELMEEKKKKQKTIDRQTAGLEKAAQEIQELQTQLKKAKKARKKAVRKNEELQSQLESAQDAQLRTARENEELQTRLQTARDARDKAARQNEKLQTQLQTARDKESRAKKRLQALESSHSYRLARLLTAPYRVLKRLIGRLKGGTVAGRDG